MTPTHKVEGSDEGSLVGKKGPIDEVRGGAVLCRASDERKSERAGRNTFSMTVHFRKLKQGVGVIRLCTYEVTKPLRICRFLGWV